MLNTRTPERFHAYQTAENTDKLGDGLPPCPPSIQGRQARILWARSAAILAARKPPSPAHLRALEQEILAAGEGPYPSPSSIARRTRAREEQR